MWLGLVIDSAVVKYPPVIVIQFIVTYPYLTDILQYMLFVGFGRRGRGKMEERHNRWMMFVNNVAEAFPDPEIFLDQSILTKRLSTLSISLKPRLRSYEHGLLRPEQIRRIWCQSIKLCSVLINGLNNFKGVRRCFVRFRRIIFFY